MIWQDIFISGVNILFSLSLVPQVYHGFKCRVGPIKFQTSVPTAAGLFAVSPVFFSLNLHFTALMSFVAGGLWLLLVVQRIRYHKK